MTTPGEMARILRADLGTAAAGIAYAERIARNADLNPYAAPNMAHDYREAARILREQEQTTCTE